MKWTSQSIKDALCPVLFGQVSGLCVRMQQNLQEDGVAAIDVNDQHDFHK